MEHCCLPLSRPIYDAPAPSTRANGVTSMPSRFVECAALVVGEVITFVVSH